MKHRYTVLFCFLFVATINCGLSGNVTAQTVPSDPRAEQLRSKQLEFQTKIYEAFKCNARTSEPFMEGERHPSRFLGASPLRNP